MCESALRLLLTSGMMWHNMDTILLVKQVVQLYMAFVVSIYSRYGLRIEIHYRNQPNKT